MGIGGTVADVLSVMEMLDNELETGSGETDEQSAITALQQAQNWFETVCSTYPRVLQDVVNIVTVANTETTQWPSALLRLDAIWLLDANGNPIRKLDRIEETGGHAPSLPWPLDITTMAGATGTPFGYYGNMANFYWLPTPAGVNSLRIYGLLEKARFVNRTSDFNYPYRCHLPFAAFADRLLQQGADDVSLDLEELANQAFGPLLKQLKKFDRTSPHGRDYTEHHTT